MPEFSYRVLDKKGEIQTGVLVARDVAAASAELYSAGYTALDISADGPTFAMRLNQPVTFFDRPSPRHIQSFIRDLGRLLGAGLSMDDTLRLLQNMQTSDMLARAIDVIRDKVRQGETLAASLSGYDQYFNVQVVAGIQAGELSGTLPEALNTIANSMDQALSFRERVRGALVYPCILMVMVAATFVLVMTFVLPQFAPLFTGNEDKLPWATNFVMGLGRLFAEQWYLIALFVTIFIVAAIHIVRDEKRWGHFLEQVCKIPGVKPWLLTPDMIRFVRTLGVCTKSGVPLDSALAMSVNAVKMQHVSEALVDVRKHVRRGGLLSDAFQRVDWIPALVLQFTRVGEQSGRLGNMLDEAATIVAQDYENRLEKALEILSPVLTLVMGGIVALLVGSVLLGIMSINDVAL